MEEEENRDRIEEEQMFVDKIALLLRQTQKNGPSHRSGPAEIMEGLYLGDYSDADSLGLLSELGITHVLNCASAIYHVTETGNDQWCPFPPEVGIREYKQLDAEDTSRYDIGVHFKTAFEFIDSAIRGEYSIGKVLVYCAKGVNRSATICVGYLMHDQRMDLLSAIRTVALARGRVLTNSNFQRQLVRLASNLDLLF